MTAAEFIKLKIDLTGKTVEEFADDIDMPRNELCAILNTDIRYVRADKIDRICTGLSLDVDDVVRFL